MFEPDTRRGGALKVEVAAVAGVGLALVRAGVVARAGSQCARLTGGEGGEGLIVKALIHISPYMNGSRTREARL